MSTSGDSTPTRAMATMQRSNSSRQLHSAGSSANTSPQSSNRSSISIMHPQKSLAKVYLLAQQIDYVHSGASITVRPLTPHNPLLPVETFSSILSVQWTTCWTIPLNQSTTSLDILKYISQKANREVKFLQLADSEGKVLDHDYLLISHHGGRKFVVFEDINIESISGGHHNGSGSGNGGHNSRGVTGEPSSPLIVSHHVDDHQHHHHAGGAKASTSPNGLRKLPPAPPPRSPSSFVHNNFNNNINININHHNDDPNDNYKPTSLAPGLFHGGGQQHNQLLPGTDSRDKSPTTSPGSSRKNSREKDPPVAPPIIPPTTTTSSYSYCKFLDNVQVAPNNPPTTERGKILDNYFNHYYQELFKYIHQRSRRYQRVVEFVKESKLDDNAAHAWMSKHYDNESNFLRNKRAGMKLDEFKILTQIGRGGFGQVFLAIKRDTGQVVTLKRIRKQAYQWANQRFQVSQEKTVMSEGSGRWITRLLYAFQDPNYLYLAMEYHCGGDFRTLLNNLGMLNEDDARFYMAEMIEALHSLHVLKLIHRDIKPSNFVIDRHGHIKLIDFGLSKEGIECRNGLNQKSMSDFRKSCLDGSIYTSRLTLNSSRGGTGGVVAYRRPVAHSAVGSPEYMAPEILADEGYNQSCDYWSLGCVFIEMLCGFNPFCADTPSEVFLNIMQYREVLDWPLFTQDLSPEAADILKRMLCESPKRMSRLEDFKAHPFFNVNGLTWDSILEQKAPFKPKVESDIDTSYFEEAVNNDPSAWDDPADETDRPRDPFLNLNIPFFTYRKSTALPLLEGFHYNQTR
ncbi:hypothetical protein SAMD00019534_024150 [Acytostelium subglobosum LB1]|uniref:hypothetical protein n=1 Tax=Acytostelium subglobosum LB1 TaxID=1410327 RepID=UPI00064514B8|nr:hypothetical protein SAMD00019534_024150 [Acytostelium subglobosum LB1]GAM19240.1 hypothetical protein SAMD00019534_024150 [Acytostelium subglobosum LB1]|eukprot:XP_012757167.1 hypothetical protein SAMD00019534_024150 [Acytostelium subglobosum LB1]